MNSQMKHYLGFLGVGALGGLLALISIVAALMVSKGSPLHSFITKLFDGINKPVELIPGLGFLAERQDPILSLGFMALYWAMIGALVGSLVFVVSACRRRAKKSPSRISHNGS